MNRSLFQLHLLSVQPYKKRKILENPSFEPNNIILKVTHPRYILGRIELIRRKIEKQINAKSDYSFSTQKLRMNPRSLSLGN